MTAFAVFALSGCNTPLGTEIARAAARDAVDDVVQSRFPGVPVTPVTDCVIDNASGGEIATIAAEAAAGAPGPRTIETVGTILSRDSTIACLVQQAGPLVVAEMVAA